ncbi:MAG TPA: WD40 repeat domain-containing protein, partial [Spirochaetota bacterium]|nr:WD40 repeat domain-containing protein [Spirochaetota bacterium]
MNEIEKSKQGNELSLYESLGIVPPKTKKIFHIIGGHTNSINAVCYSPDGSKILSGSSDGTIKEWD